MSLDYPYYEELCRQQHRAAWWWIIGDRLYYLGLLSAAGGVSGLGPALVVGFFGSGWHWLILTAITFVVGSVVFVLGSYLKGHAYTLGERDGISAADVYERDSSPQSPER